MRVPVQKDQCVAQRCGVGVENSEHDEERGGGTAIGEHIELGAKLGRLVELAGGKAVGTVKDEADKVIKEEGVRIAVVGKGNGGEDDAEISDDVGDVKPDGPVALGTHDEKIKTLREGGMEGGVATSPSTGTCSGERDGVGGS